MLALDVELDRGNGFALRARAQLAPRVTGLYGPSGAGKTTLLHAIAGLERPARGRIAIDDTVLFDSGERIDLPPHRRRIGLVFQDLRLLPHYSVRGNLEYGERARPRNERRIRLDDVVSLLELGPLLRRRPHELSGGEQRRVALGRALLMSPRILLLDEPLAALDPARKSQILPYLQRLRDATDIAMVYVSHDLAEILQLTDFLLVLAGGRSVGCGPVHDLSLGGGPAGAALTSSVPNVLAMTIVEHAADEGFTRLRSEGRAHAASRTAAAMRVYAGNRGGGGTPAEEQTVAGGPTPDATPLELQGPLIDAALGTHAAILIRPEDIALARERVERISVRNQLAGTLRRHTQQGGKMLLEIETGGEFLLAEISAGSYRRLGLETGCEVVCLIKANALRVLSVRE